LRELDAGLGEGKGLAGVADEQGLVVERVHVGRAAVHEEEDDASGTGAEPWRSGGEGRAGCGLAGAGR